MAKDTPSMAKNKIKRSLWAIYDPHPKKSEIDSLWEYFESKCVYCGIAIDRKSRTGHVDHVIPSSIGGSNNIHNHVLACARCNGDEKREENWVCFLKRKLGDGDAFEKQLNNIEEWISKAPRVDPNDDEYFEVQKLIVKALSDFDSSVIKMRELSKRKNFD